MKKFKKHLLAALLAVTPLMYASGVQAQNLDTVKQTITKSLHEQVPTWPRVEEVKTTPVNGLYEVRLGDSEIMYTDASGHYIIIGEMMDLKNMRNLTQERVSALTAIAFKDLPLQNAITIKRGDGSRKIAVFEDPQCGYCHRFEQQLQTIDNVTVYVFLYPILSEKSHEASKNIWCAKDPQKTWLDWMLNKTEPKAVDCDIAVLQQNVEMGRKYKIEGTPTIIFEDGSRIPGAVDAEAIEMQFQRIQADKK